MRAQNIYRKNLHGQIFYFRKILILNIQKHIFYWHKHNYINWQNPNTCITDICFITYQYKRASEASSKNQCARETERATPTDSLRKFFGQHIYEMMYTKEISIDNFEI